jgi:hypothetical protein
MKRRKEGGRRERKEGKEQREREREKTNQPLVSFGKRKWISGKEKGNMRG